MRPALHRPAGAMAGAMILLAATLATAATPTVAPLPSVDDVIARAIAARGGIARLKAVRTQRMTGTISFAGQSPAPFMVEMKRPLKMRQQFSPGGRVIVSTLDGSRGWMLNSARPPAVAETLSAAQAKSMAGAADIDGPLIDWRAKGNRVELVGMAAVEGHDSYRVKVTTADGDVRYDYIDVASGLERKWEGQVGPEGNRVGFESFFRDYRRVFGIAFPFEIDSDAPGTNRSQKIIFTRVLVNPPIADAEFGKPRVPPAAGR